MEAVNATTKNETSPQHAVQFDITYFTDPLCCWSWGFEPHWRKLLQQYSGRIRYRYCMAGMLPDWTKYNDTVNHVSRPIQMGPVWMHASQVTGMPMKNTVWFIDPPASSYPACIAVKCVMLQSETAGDEYLRMCREAIMVEGKNISKTDVLYQLATILEGKMPGEFSKQAFEIDMTNENGIDAFRSDLNLVKLTGIERYPSLLVKSNGAKPILITGYKPYEILETTFRQMSTQ